MKKFSVYHNQLKPSNPYGKLSCLLYAGHHRGDEFKEKYQVAAEHRG